MTWRLFRTTLLVDAFIPKCKNSEAWPHCVHVVCMKHSPPPPVCEVLWGDSEQRVQFCCFWTFWLVHTSLRSECLLFLKKKKKKKKKTGGGGSSSNTSQATNRDCFQHPFKFYEPPNISQDTFSKNDPGPLFQTQKGKNLGDFIPQQSNVSFL